MREKWKKDTSVVGSFLLCAFVDRGVHTHVVLILTVVFTDNIKQQIKAAWKITHTKQIK